MAKKTETKLTGKKAIKKMVANNLESLMVKLNPEMGNKKLSKKLKKQVKYWLKG